MSEQNIRPYSMLIYGLQDDFIGVLKPESLENKGHIKNPKMVLKNDGAQELSFSIPMYYTEPLTGARIINPMWAHTRSEELLANLRKIKVILHTVKNDEGFYPEEVHEFVITSKTDKHSNGMLECDIKCDGLAFKELGGTGYKLSLTQDDFLVEYNEWADRLNKPQEDLKKEVSDKNEASELLESYQNELEVKKEDSILNQGLKEKLEVLNNKYKNNYTVVNGITQLTIGGYNFVHNKVATEKSEQGIKNAQQVVASVYSSLESTYQQALDALNLYYPEPVARNILACQDRVLSYAKNNSILQNAQKNNSNISSNFYEINNMRGWLAEYIAEGEKSGIVIDRTLLYRDAEKLSDEDADKVRQELSNYQKDGLTDNAQMSEDFYKLISGYVERGTTIPEDAKAELAGIFTNPDDLEVVVTLANYINRWQAYGREDAVNYGTTTNDAGETIYYGSIRYYETIRTTTNENRAKVEEINTQVQKDWNEYQFIESTMLINKSRINLLTGDLIPKLEEKIANHDEKIKKYTQQIENLQSQNEPHMSINYWCDKVFDLSTPWRYKVAMDWDEKKGRDADKVYEDEYVSSWVLDENSTLVAERLEKAQEKYRALNCTDSNRYNITQEIAKAFGVYCRYEYEHDEFYHITGRTVVFYNNFFVEDSRFLDITYPYQSDDIQRTIEGADVITKLYVKDIEDATQVSGIISIADAEANKTGEDYILNFDYVHSIGSITDEQYEEVPKFESAMHDINMQIKSWDEQLISAKNDLPEYNAQLTTARDAQIKAQEQITEAQMAKNACIGNTDGIAYRGGFNTDTGLWMQGVFGTACTSSMAIQTVSGNPPLTLGYTYRVRVPDEGVIPETISLFYSPNLTNGVLNADRIVQYENGNELTPNWIIIKDEVGMVIAVDLKEKVFKDRTQHTVYWSYKYRPSLKYELAIQTYTKEYERQQKLYKEASIKVDELNDRIASLEDSLAEKYEEKNKLLADFHRLMGAAIHEGSWQDESYKDYGQKKEIELTWDNNQSADAQLVWDFELFKDEDKNYQEEGTSRVYYPFIPISDELLNSLGSISFTQFKNKLDSIFICYTGKVKDGLAGSETTYTIGPNAGFTYQLLMPEGQTQPILAAVISDTHFLQYMNNSGNEILEIFFAQISVDTVSTEKGYEFNTTYDRYDIGETPILLEDGSPDYTTVYARVNLNAQNLKTAADRFIVELINTENSIEDILEKYSEYSLLSGENRKNENSYRGWLITPKLTSIITLYGENWRTFGLRIKYELSNASTSLYLDALEVMKTNAFPQISYQVKVGKISKGTMRNLPNYLNTIIYINDPELFLDEVTGYVSEVELSLDAPWEDVIVTKDYRTKFEDLFSSIVAATEQMKSNGAAYDAAAAAFSVSGDGVLLNEATLLNSLGHYNLAQQYQSGKLTISNDGIIALSDEGAVAMSGGGIFCATEKDDMERWIWNTGITPAGINASMITSGHLDTNNIKVYAGDNVALQLDKNGLFAFKDYYDSKGAVQYYNDTYVVHNDEGLFFHEPVENRDDGVDRVEISWEGLIMRDTDGNKVLYADDSGHLMINNATINNATISNLKIAELETLTKGVTFTPTNGTTFKYENGVFSPNRLNWSIALAYVKWNENDINESSAFTVYRSFEDLGTDDAAWKNAEKIAISEDGLVSAGHLTFTVKSGIMKESGSEVVHGVCYLRVVTRCLQTRDDTSWTDVKYITLFNVSNGEQGKNAPVIEITSTQGDIITEEKIDSDFELTAHVYEGYEEVDIDGLGLRYRWLNSNAETIHFGKTFSVNASNIDFSETYYCEVTEGEGTILSQPVSNSDSIFTVTTTVPATFRWQYLKSDGSWGNTTSGMGTGGSAKEVMSSTFTATAQKRTWRCLITFEDGYEMFTDAVQYIEPNP